MFKEGNFGSREAISLAAMLVITRIFFTGILALLKRTGTASWYATLISAAVSILLFLVVSVLMSRFPGKDLVAVFEEVTGKIAGKLLALAFCAYFVYYSGSQIREFIEMIKAYNLPYTPPSAIVFTFLGVVIFACYHGLEGIARLSYISFLITLISIALILILAFPNYDVDNLFPLGGYGLGATVYNGFLRSSAYSDVIVLAFLVNSIGGARRFRKIGVVSLALSGAIISITCLCELMAFEFPQTSENLSSLFQLSRIIYFSRFFQRIESIFLFSWVIAAIITVSVGFYTAVSIFCKACRVPNHRPGILPFAFFTFLVALLPESLTDTVEINLVFLRQYSILLVYLIPILVLVIAVLRGKKGEDAGNEKA